MIAKRIAVRAVAAGLGLLVMTLLALRWERGRERRAPSRAESADVLTGLEPPVPEIAHAVRGGRPVLFVGLDGGDWQLLDEFMAGGAMPHLAAIVEEGRSGILTTLHPPLSPLVWTTMMTGVSPIEHGILDFTRFNPVSGAREPITSGERRVPAIWNMASCAGKSVAVFGLWATWPAEPVRGVLVSDRLFSFQYQEDRPPGAAVFPAARGEWAARALESAEREIDFAALRAYLPWLDEREYERAVHRPDPYAEPPSALRRILVETRVYHTLASSWYREQQPDLAIVYLQGTDTIGHLFAPYAPPRQKEISPIDFERYGRVPERYFSYVDSLLGEYRELAEARGAILMIASDHGFRWKAGRPRTPTSFAAATAGRWHRDEGIYVLWGPNVTPALRGEARSGVAQVCSTLLALLGMPAGRGLEGPLAAVGVAAGGEGADYRTSCASPAVPKVPEGEPERVSAAPEQLEKLRALGYIGAGEAVRALEEGGQSTSTRTAGSWNNEGLILGELGRKREAREAFERAIALDPRLASALWNLSELLFAEEPDLARSNALLVRAAAEGLPDGVEAIVKRAIVCQRSGRIGSSESLLEAAVEALPGEAALWLFRGRYRLDREDCAGAKLDFEHATRLDPASAIAWASSGLTKLCLGDGKGASADFRRSLAIDPNQPQLRRSLESP